MRLACSMDSSSGSTAPPKVMTASITAVDFTLTSSTTHMTPWPSSWVSIMMPAPRRNQGMLSMLMVTPGMSGCTGVASSGAKKKLHRFLTSM